MTSLTPRMRAARQLVAPRFAWTKGSFARTALGHTTSPLSRSAVRFCTIGAIQRASATDLGDVNGGLAFDADAVSRYESMAAVFLTANDIAISIDAWQDNIAVTHDHVLKAFDDTIEYLMRRED